VEKNKKNPEEVDLIAHEILEYLAKHQFAADTVEGICHWWISKQRIEEAQQRVLAALQHLVKNERVVRRRLPDGTLLYSAPTQEQDNTSLKH
jgi:hypothetical protein